MEETLCRTVLQGHCGNNVSFIDSCMKTISLDQKHFINRGLLVAEILWHILRKKSWICLCVKIYFIQITFVNQTWRLLESYTTSSQNEIYFRFQLTIKSDIIHTSNILKPCQQPAQKDDVSLVKWSGNWKIWSGVASVIMGNWTNITPTCKQFLQ